MYFPNYSMKQLFLAGTFCMALALELGAQPIPLWENRGRLTEPPQIDATAFLNAGSMTFFTRLPFDTQNTLYFTNRGEMLGSVGFRFNYISDLGRLPASRFENLSQITALDSGLIFYSEDGVGFGGSLAGSYILVSATNIVNEGIINAGANGIVRLEGQRLDLRNGGISASEGTGFFDNAVGTGVISGTNYINPPDVNDLYWGVGNNNSLTPDQGNPINLQAGLFATPSPRSPLHEVVSSFGITNTVQVPTFIDLTSTNGTNLFNYKDFTSYVYTNVVSETNEIIQIVFIPTGTSLTNLVMDVRFAPGTGGDPNGQKAIVQIGLKDIDVVSGDPITNFVYFADDSASSTNITLFENLTGTTLRPSAFEVFRSTPMDWTLASPSNALLGPLLIYNQNYGSTEVSNVYSAYSAQIGLGEGATNQFNLFGFGGYYGIGSGNPALSDPTNFPGRVELIGNQVDLTESRMRSEALFTLRTSNLVSTAGAKLDAPLYSIDVGSTNHTMIISNLFPQTVKRLKGQLAAWSGVWTNQRLTVVATPDPASTNINQTTNQTDLKFHVLILDHSIQGVQDVTANEFVVRAPNVVVADDVRVNQHFQANAQDLTIQGQFTLPGGLGSTNLPQLMNFTNEGTIRVPIEFNLGADRFQRYDSVVNKGLLSAGGIQIRSTNFLAAGGNYFLSTNQMGSLTYASGGSMQIDSLNTFVNDAALFASTDIILSGRDLYLRQAALMAGGSSSVTGGGIEIPGILSLRATHSLSDGGLGASNNWRCVGSLQLMTRPTQGDLLGTTIETISPRFAITRHIWSAEDRGLSPAGYSNNAAIGHLILDGRPSSRFIFSGAFSNSALYVDYLELRNNATNYTSTLSIEDGMRVYFANANVSADKLNGSFGGKLRWVTSYAGPNSTTNLVMPSGQVRPFNIALVMSADLDSDGDGIVNRLDQSPFFVDESVGLAMQVNRPAKTAQLTWTSLAGATNSLEFTSDLAATQWQVLTNFVHSGTTGKVAAQDQLPAQGQRYYRVRIFPREP